MKIKCNNCGHIEKTEKDFFVNLIGGAMPVGGFWAWTTYLFAGTGFAMAIVVAIIGGGVAMLIYKDEIVEWIINNDYKCSNCGKVKWSAYDTDKNESEISTPRVIISPSVKPASPSVEPHNIKVQEIIDKAECLLRDKGVEFERTDTGWLILELSGDLKVINSFVELAKYASGQLSPKNKEEAELLILSLLLSSQNRIDSLNSSSVTNDIN